MSENQVGQLRLNAGRYEDGIIRVIRTVQVFLLLYFIIMALELAFTTSSILESLLLFPLPIPVTGIESVPLQMGLYLFGLLSPVLLIYTLDLLIE